MSLDHPLAVVVGAAGGIGAAVARALSSTHRLDLVDRDEQGLALLAQEVPAAHTRVHDVVDAAACADLVEQIQREAGDIDLLVLTAGLSAFGDVPTGDVDRWRRVFNVNTLSVMYLARAALQRMLARRHGHIVVVASASGRITYVGEPAYVASKHATVAFCDCLRKEIVGTGVRVTLIEPGLVDTPMAQAHPCYVDALKTVTPLRADDVAAAVGFAVAQPANVCINEIVIRPVDQLL
jgi:NADP-dependent 3-hydroxy acid dehydrogenase YdfG